MDIKMTMHPCRSSQHREGVRGIGRLGLFPFRKRSLPLLTVDAIIGNQAFSRAGVIVCSGLLHN